MIVFKFAVFLLAICIKYSSASCVCYQPQNYTGRSAPIGNSYQESDFSPCFLNSPPCSYVAYSGDDTYGWTGLILNWATTTGSGGLLEIFDGSDASGTPLIQVQEGDNILAGSPKNIIKSTSPRIYIRYNQTGNGSNAYYGTIRAESGLSPSVAPTTPTVAPVTRSFSSPDFPKDPYLITHDILVVINQRTNGGSSALRGVNAIAINFVGQLSTTTNANSDSGTRLSLASLTPYDPYYALRGDIWGLNASTLTTALPYNGIAIEGNIDQALTGLVDLAFTVNQNTTADSRRNVQRSIILFTGEWPTNAQLSLDVKNKFDSKGVNLLIVGYNLTDTEQSQLLRTDNRWYNAVNTQQTKSPAVASFVNPFYFNDGSATNYWCPPHPVTPSVDTTYVWFQEPYNYAGPYGTQDWNGFSSYDGQSNRYCNFANSVYTYNMPSTANTMKVQVFFELEAGKDFLNFYDASNNLIASFTGYDISASTFYTSTTTLTARFISDNQSIYRGFYVSITPQTL